MMKTFFLFFFLSSVLRADIETNYFPLEKGNYWIYKGETKFLVKNPDTDENEPKSEILTWKMEVIDTVTRNNLFAALIKGMPEDLSWYNPGKQRGDYLIVKVGSSTYYQSGGEGVLNAWAKLNDKKDNLSGLNGIGLFIDGPLCEGKIFGDGDSLANISSGRYCWQVDDRGIFDSKVLPIATKLQKPHIFTLSYFAAPEHEVFSFVPGIGIVSYSYGHNGTLAETSLSLIEFGTSKSTKK